MRVSEFGEVWLSCINVLTIVLLLIELTENVVLSSEKNETLVA